MSALPLSHILLTVSDLERARAFYEGLLGFEVVDFSLEHSYFFFMTGDVSIWVITHEQTPPDDRFSEFRIGLDHLSFAAPDEKWLREMADKLIAAGVDTKGVETFATGNLYMAFRDPDNIQLEYWLA